MDILIVGSGGREYSIGLALSRDKAVNRLYFAPGNGATDTLGENINIKDYQQLADFAKQNAAKLEGSKVYMKNFLAKYSIPTARYIQTSSAKEALSFIQTLKTPIVVKADGLCAGKGVIIAQSIDEANDAVIKMLSGESFGDAGSKVIVEEYLDGYELSMFAVCDGKDFILLPAAQDHKRFMKK